MGQRRRRTGKIEGEALVLALLGIALSLGVAQQGGGFVYIGGGAILIIIIILLLIWIF